ncbi:MAG: NUDIX domain-containing protein, partial [Clostridia bacterium]|nr:NUDIX domain-containing protein [Clostridia bacterium]
MENIDNILDELDSYKPFNEQEQEDKLAFSYFIDNSDIVLSRENLFGHLTTSAIVLTPDHKKMLMVHHNIFGGLIYPGGHADNINDLLSVAIREVNEETGLDVTPLEDGKLFGIQALPIEGHIKKGKYVPSHIHYDFVYLMQAKEDDLDKIRTLESENSKVVWVALDDCYGEEAVSWIRPILKKLVEK